MLNVLAWEDQSQKKKKKKTGKEIDDSWFVGLLLGLKLHESAALSYF